VLAFKQHCLPSLWLNTPTGILLFQCQIHLWLQCFLEESRSLMRLPPRPPTAEADLKVPFQQVLDTLLLCKGSVLDQSSVKVTRVPI
jgi:hypothetical protein